MRLITVIPTAVNAVLPIVLLISLGYILRQKEVVVFVLENAGGEVFEFFFNNLACFVGVADSDSLRTADFFVDARNRETTLFHLSLCRTGFENLRVDDFSEFVSGIHDEEALRDTNLRGSESYSAVGCQHWNHLI